MPKRIQRKRTKGWRKPDGAIYVGRGSLWGNPWRALRGSCVGPTWSAARSMPLLLRSLCAPEYAVALYSSHVPASDAVEKATEIFRSYCEVEARDNPDLFDMWIAPLRGHDLMCWCPLDQPCHADVLLDLANGETHG